MLSILINLLQSITCSVLIASMYMCMVVLLYTVVFCVFYQIWCKLNEISCPDNFEAAWKSSLEQVIKTRLSAMITNVRNLACMYFSSPALRLKFFIKTEHQAMHSCAEI